MAKKKSSVPSISKELRRYRRLEKKLFGSPPVEWRAIMAEYRKPGDEALLDAVSKRLAAELSHLALLSGYVDGRRRHPVLHADAVAAANHRCRQVRRLLGFNVTPSLSF